MMAPDLMAGRHEFRSIQRRRDQLAGYPKRRRFYQALLRRRSLGGQRDKCPSL